MTAMYGGTAINRGTITLTADSDIANGANQLVGMAAFGSGVAINDTTGVINIDAAFGQPSTAATAVPLLTTVESASTGIARTATSIMIGTSRPRSKMAIPLPPPVKH